MSTENQKTETMTFQERSEKVKQSFDGSSVVTDWQILAYEKGIKDFIQYGFPDIETVSDIVHEEWMKSKNAQGVTTRLSERGEELMKPYAELSEEAKDLDRNTVKAVFAAIRKAIAQ